jgi:DNA repair protein RecO (recombination protein O)
MKNERTQAIVLSRTNYGEADRIIQLLTPIGRRSVMARGVRKEKSKLAGGIELFALSDVVLGKGKGELGILTSARLIEFYPHILEDYDRMQVGYDVLKRVKRASELLDEPEWFDVLSQILVALNTLSVDIRLIQTWWYLQYALILGHALPLAYDTNGDPIVRGETYRYDSSEKGLTLNPHGQLTSDHIKFLRLLATRPLRTVAQVGGVEAILPDCLLTAREHAAME